jgi:protein PhnA
MSTLPPCPQCGSEYTYENGDLLVCPECAHEWPAVAAPAAGDEARIIKDANGTVLQDGDTITVIKDLKVKGTSLVVKVGTKVKNIRLVDGDHDIDCKIDGIGAMKLKSEFVKKRGSRPADPPTAALPRSTWRRGRGRRRRCGRGRG